MYFANIDSRLFQLSISKKIASTVKREKSFYYQMFNSIHNLKLLKRKIDKKCGREASYIISREQNAKNLFKIVDSYFYVMLLHAFFYKKRFFFNLSSGCCLIHNHNQIETHFIFSIVLSMSRPRSIYVVLM